jgi:hypothetical protein
MGAPRACGRNYCRSGCTRAGSSPASTPISISDIAALTVGQIWDLPIERGGRFGIGADFTVYNTSPDLETYFGSPNAYHVFLRWRPTGAAPAHVH